jgi:hypothetical protein
MPSPAGRPRSASATSRLLGDRLLLHIIIINAYWEMLEFELSLLTDAHEPWKRSVDTFLYARYQHHPHAVDRCGSGRQLRAPRDTDGACAARMNRVMA